MRAPRYRFPEDVRSATRGIASRMLRDGPVAETPEQLDAWLADQPDVRRSLESGGYGTAFTSEDLFPLLQAFIDRAGGSPAAAPVRGRSSRRWWWLVLALILLVLLVVFAVAAGALR